jgi:NAD-dependent DNA ligase
MSWFAKLSVDDLVEQLQKANWAYHNTSNTLMSDDDYDLGLKELERISPTHPFLGLVGALPSAKGVSIMLPMTMGSQDKVREGEKGLERWMKRCSSKFYCISEKLDGLSALFVRRGSKNSLYLRGDGVRGVDVSSILSFIRGVDVYKEDCIIRGELLLRSVDVPAGSIGRSLVNGWVHRDLADSEKLSKVRFVAYQVLEPVGMTRGAQFRWLAKMRAETPWSQTWPAGALIQGNFLKGALIQRKAASPYPLDGLVIGTDTVPVGLGGGEARNPPDSVAYKASLDEQKAETTVIGVEWNLSRQGFWIPRIQIEPVQINGATIQWLSGHNAKLMQENGIGKGARVVVRRSGDVIPTLDSVIIRAAEVSMPAAGTWEWDATRVNAKTNMKVLPEQGLLHALQVLGVEGIGPGLIKKIVEGGFTTMRKVWDAKESHLADAIGGGRAPALLSSLKEAVASASMSMLVVASNLLPRGVGDKKLRAVFAKQSDPKLWTMTMYPIEGWSEESFQEMLECIPEILVWIQESFPSVPVTVSPVAAPVLSSAATNFVVFTGVRDKVLEGLLGKAGWAIEDSVTKKTTALVVAEEAKETAKLKKARDMGVQILKLSEFRSVIQKTLG